MRQGQQAYVSARIKDASPSTAAADAGLLAGLQAFDDFGTITDQRIRNGLCYLTNEFWTSRQRAAHSLHEISYRACFKPQLPRFFIDRLSAPGDTIYDPFMGRGTTVLEAALAGRNAIGNDINPLSRILIAPRLRPPSLDAIGDRLRRIPDRLSNQVPEELLVFYHPEVLEAVCALREYFLERIDAKSLDAVDAWIRMVAINRLTGHSSGFFSVYTMPPNQAVSAESQARINDARKQVPPRRDVRKIILTKSKSLLRDVSEHHQIERGFRLLVEDARRTSQIEDASVDLVVTSPPFLDVVDYSGDNWLRCWFAGIDPAVVPITRLRKEQDWKDFTRSCFQEFARIVRPGGHVAFEVGEVRNATVRLEELVTTAIQGLAFATRFILINAQHFTKTANCWGVANNKKGTNTNRVVVMERV